MSVPERISQLATAAEEQPRVLCIAPAWNEGERIGRVVRAVPTGAVERTVVVDDGSTDDTASYAERAGATVIRAGENRGVGAAIRSGIDYAREHGYDVVVIVSGGGKTPPEQIPRLLQPILDGRAEFVQGSRYKEGGEFLRMPLRRRLGTRAYTMLFSFFVGRRVTDASSGFRAIKLSLLEDGRIDLWQEWLDRYELEPYLLFKAFRLGHRVVEVPVTIEYPEENDGIAYTKMRALVDWWKIFRPVVFLGLGIKK
ncbi:MAG TPA: glycosyltransferase family 2 protein [Blastocatellia bacterium]|jgi:dolichol-phosphate mannosyltransferase|nr:glycosyltransferase family 2 protein [Blastocatellia bacterium]